MVEVWCEMSPIGVALDGVAQGRSVFTGISDVCLGWLRAPLYAADGRCWFCPFPVIAGLKIMFRTMSLFFLFIDCMRPLDCLVPSFEVLVACHVSVPPYSTLERGPRYLALAQDVVLPQPSIA